ncbi:MAG: methyltransferase domain-containing protein [Nitrospirota bacterium]|nr:MAG: methyltransferase domain-containing protein [Nitrospirota bacterium]
MPTKPFIQSLKQFRDVAYGFRLPRIIFTALDLDLFNIMGRRTWTIPQLSKQLRTSQRGLEILCRSLASTGLLIKSHAGFRTSTFAHTYLQKSSKAFRGDYLALMQGQWKEWSRLTEVVTSGSPVDSQEPETPEYRRSFTWAMHHRSQEPARQVAKQVSMKTARSFLDLGGGPGTYALAFLKANSQLHATVMDRPAALEVAQTLAKQASVEHRLSLQAGNFINDKIVGTYDIVWYSNVLHIYSPSETLKVLKKIRRALKPGGRLIIQDTFLEDAQGLRPLETNLFAVTMLLYTDTGNTYSRQDVRTWLHKAGLSRTRLIRLQKGTGDWEGRLLEGRRPVSS